MSIRLCLLQLTPSPNGVIQLLLSANAHYLKIADAIESRADEIIAIESENCGKPIGLTTSEEVPPMIDQIRFFAGAARNLEGKSAGEYMKGMTSFIRREPVGVCGQVTPWNYPMMMAVWKWAPAIAAGNSVVLKPSDTTPASTVFMAEIMGEFLPDGVINVICGERETGKAVVEHATPAMVSITGSVRAGMEVAGSAAKQLKRVHLELGGKAPVVVFNDADLEAAAAGIAIAGFFNSGQDCTAATRVLVQEGVYEEMVKLLAHQATNEIAVGMPNEDVIVGPVNNAAQFERVKGFLDRVPSHARVVAGGSALDRAGYFIAPTVIADFVSRMSTSNLKSSDRSSPSRNLKMRPKRSPFPMASSTVWHHLSGPRITAPRCAWPRPLTSDASGSTPISQSLPRCRTVASSALDTARIFRATASRITPASSTS